MEQYTDLELQNHSALFGAVLNEHCRQIEKWGVQTHSLFEWGNYLTEEVGEVAKAISENAYRKGSLEDIYKECIQVATLSLKIAEMVKERILT